MVYKGDENTSEPAEALKVDGVVIDEQKRIVTVDDAEIDLTDIEFQLLVLLVKNRGQVFSAERLYETIWKESYYYSANNTVMVHMRNLRKKIEKDPQNPQIIKTIWGKGYRCD